MPFFTNSSMMDVDFLPEHLVIVGGSYIGLEFGQMYRRFGSEVTIVEMGPRLIGREDEDGAAKLVAFNNGDRHPRGRKPRRQRRACLFVR